MISFDQQTCCDLTAALDREWLEANGLGGFASSTIVGLNTRRYHGLLIAATRPPVGRMVLLSKLEETLVIDGESFELSSNQYPGIIHPQGFQHQTRFRLDPFPMFTYQIGSMEIEKAVFMVRGENTTVVQYRLRGAAPGSVRLEVRPLIAFRDYHSTTHENGALNGIFGSEPGLISMTPYEGVPRMYLAHDADAVKTTGQWYRNFEYRVEQERGLDFREDLFNPLAFHFDFGRHSAVTIIASTEPHSVGDAPQLRKSETARRLVIAKAAPVKDELVRSLVTAADQFIVARGEQKTVIAGYHWFSDWGRDTMVALPGLTLVTGRFDLARSVLLTFAKYVDQGMLPNRFPDAGEQPEYNTVDGTLWFFEAIRAYVEYSGDYALVRKDLYGLLNDVIAWHVRGRRLPTPAARLYRPSLERRRTPSRRRGGCRQRAPGSRCSSIRCRRRSEVYCCKPLERVSLSRMGSACLVSAPFHRLFALDPETGSLLWQFDPKFDTATRVVLYLSRGATLGKDGSRKRIFLGDLSGLAVWPHIASGGLSRDGDHRGLGQRRRATRPERRRAQLRRCGRPARPGYRINPPISAAL